METRYEEANKITIQSILWNVVLTIIKVIAGVIGNSSAMIADGLHSASDIISSIGVLIGNYVSSRPGDREHNYGHEKAETLVSFVLSILLIFVSITIGIEAIKSLFNLDALSVPSILPLVVSVISILIKEYQYRITIKVAKKINSPALKADAWHHRSDALSSVAAFIGIGGSILGFKPLDPIASIVVAIFVAKVGISILISSVNELMDVSVDEEEIKELKFIVADTEGVKNLGDIKTRKHGAMAYVDLTICVDENLTVKQGHDIATKLEKHIIKHMEFVKGITVHVETVALLSKLDVDKHIDVEIKLDELDLTSAESKATYAQIKEYVLEKFGLKVSTLYIAQIKKKCGIELREHYNKSKKDNQAIPQCTPEKEEAIMDALRHFKMI
ncbi:cation efflux protein [Clostridioides difficile]|nr:cation diffusion facilitator family transporter [Clostridioides difficile]VHY69358.1 cation efflux protein [Clostridioides difficile]VHY96728.1 cation efflux protein [Clostridioides difficile]